MSICTHVYILTQRHAHIYIIFYCKQIICSSSPWMLMVIWCWIENEGKNITHSIVRQRSRVTDLIWAFYHGHINLDTWSPADNIGEICQHRWTTGGGPLRVIVCPQFQSFHIPKDRDRAMPTAKPPTQRTENPQNHKLKLISIPLGYFGPIFCLSNNNDSCDCYCCQLVNLRSPRR